MDFLPYLQAFLAQRQNRSAPMPGQQQWFNTQRFGTPGISGYNSMYSRPSIGPGVRNPGGPLPFEFPNK